jgi:hypothetical protein
MPLNALTGAHRRDLAANLDRIAAWNAATVDTLVGSAQRPPALATMTRQWRQSGACRGFAGRRGETRQNSKP